MASKDQPKRERKKPTKLLPKLQPSKTSGRSVGQVLTTHPCPVDRGRADEPLSWQARPPPPRALPSRGSAALQVVQRRELAQRNTESRSVVGEDRWTDSTVVASRWTGEARP